MAERQVPTLIQRPKSAKARERQEAAVCLGALGKWAAAAVPALTEALQDIRSAVSRAAAAALGKIKG
jgi:HEAT repeat protein